MSRALIQLARGRVTAWAAWPVIAGSRPRHIRHCGYLRVEPVGRPSLSSPLGRPSGGRRAGGRGCWRPGRPSPSPCEVTRFMSAAKAGSFFPVGACGQGLHRDHARHRSSRSCCPPVEEFTVHLTLQSARPHGSRYTPRPARPRGRRGPRCRKAKAVSRAGPTAPATAATPPLGERGGGGGVGQLALSVASRCAAAALGGGLLPARSR